MFGSIRWRIGAAFLVLVLVCMGGLSGYLLHTVRDSNLDGLRTQLASQAHLVSDASEPYFDQGHEESLDALAERLGDEAGTRITIIAADGTVLGDSGKDPEVMESHASRPEVVQALSEGVGSSIRYSTTLGCDMLYVAVPVMVGGKVAGVARISLSLAEIDKSLGQINTAIIAGTAIAAVVAILVALWVSRATTEPLKQLTQMSRRIASGELDQKIQVSSGDEVGELARAFNQMSARLGEMVGLLTSERDKMAAIVSTMDSSVVIVDGKRRVNMVNRAAEELFRISEEGSLGHTFIEVVRDHELNDVLQKCLRAGKQQEGLVEAESGKQFLRVVATPLEQGALVMLHDLTRLRRLETVRRDFIVNISHELRTPITSLKVLTETLQDGAVDDSAVARDFLDKINAEADRMAQMVSELGELSRIESGEVSLRMETVDVGEVMERAADRLMAQVGRGGLTLDVNAPADLPEVLADKERIEQVLVNLIHNAIKFTPRGGKISLSARTEADDILVSVADTGAGIPAEDLPRIFERFYKVDKARTGGGTGLGLAIARHVVEAYGGRIWVEGVEGKGSTFIFTLPVNRP